MTKSTLELIAKELDVFFSPINRRLRAGAIADLMLELGWYWPDEAQLDIGNVIEKLDSLVDILAQLNTESDVPEYLDAIRAAVEVSQAIFELSDKIPNPNDLNDFTDDTANALLIIQDNAELLGQRATSLLIVSYLQARLPALLGVLQLSGVIQISRVTPDSTHPGFDSIEINWGRFARLLTEPERLFAELYDWGQPTSLMSEELLRGVKSLALGLGLPATLRVIPFRLERAMLNALCADTHVATLGQQLEIPLLDTFSTEFGSTKLGLRLFATPDPRNPSEGLKGLAILVFAEGQTQLSVEITEELKFETGGSFGADFAVLLLPGGRVEFVEGLLANGSVDMTLAVGLVHERGGSPFVIFGSEQGSRLEYSSFGTMVGLSGSPTDPDFYIELNLDGASIIIKGSDGDGFLGNLLPKEPLVISLESVIGVSSKRGFYISGSGGLEATLPLHINLGPIDLESVYIALGFGVSEQPIVARVGLSASVELGPISVSIQRIGVKLLLSVPNDGGNLGPADLDIGFLFPTGAGLSVDAEGIIGGGFLDFDQKNNRYTGVLALAFGEISITAIGLIETKLPDGKKGFSMLVNICVEFNPPIDLSYGFTLGGIGGLIGINRIMVTEALQRGIKNHTLDSILFPDPDSVIINASKIISDMRTVFPPEEGRFIIGPMLKLGWGYPTVITGELGIFVEFPPDPLRVALIGQLNAAFPHEELGYLLINLDILGILDTEKQELTFQASLFDSAMMSYPHIYSITGDAAFLLNWGSTPDFALSVGGFHPKFDPPPPDYIFSDLRYMQMTVTYYGIVNLACKAYLALTPNTLQFGARVEIYVSQAGFDIGGAMGFDALINFSPFSFEVSICGYVWVKAQGISLMDIYITADLSGPNPWNVNGEAKVQMLFFDFTADFSIAWGDAQKAVIAAQDPLPQLINALSGPGNWSSRLPYKRSMVETLRSFEEHEDTPDIIIVHPTGRLEIRQNAVPFNITLEKVGNAPVTGHDRFKITGLEAGTQLNPEYVREFFARGQFEELSNAKKLSVPSFEKMDGGVTTAASQAIRFDANKVEDKELTYETILLNPDLTADRVGPIGKSNWDHTQKLMAGSAAQLSAKKAGSNKRFKDMNMEPKATLHEERYCIVSAIDLVPIALPKDISSQNLFNSRTEADQALDSHCSQTPRDRNEILVIPECEVPASEAIA